MSMNLYNPDTNELTQVAGNGTITAIIPDYSKAKKIGITPTVSYNVTEDGFVFGFFGNIDDDEGSFIRQLYVNDALAISSAGVVNVSERVSFNIPFMITVKKGDVVKLVGGEMYGEIKFCPPRKVLAPSSAVVDKVEVGNMNAVTSNAVADKIDKIIDDANYFVGLPNGCYTAIGNMEKHSPNDGSGLHLYITSIYSGWCTQLCVSHGTGRTFIRNGTLSTLDTRDWVELATTKRSVLILPGTTFTLDVTDFNAGEFTGYYYGGVAYKGGFVSKLYGQHSNVNLTFVTNNFDNTMYFSVSSTQFKITNNSSDSITLVYELVKAE